ncbi:MAG: hypothetical protein IJX81_04785 [Clostridia bacterium]|nr:hypothetical protein [Clostridia bacterium]
MEVLARKKRGMTVLYAIVGVITAALFTVSVTILPKSADPFVILLIGLFGVVCVGLCVKECVLSARTPDVILQTDGKTLYLPKGKQISVLAVQKVEYKRASARGFQYDYGKLMLITANGRYTFHYVDEVVEAHNALIALMMKLREEKTEKEE